MFGAFDVPMELVAYGEGLNRDILGEKKDEYDESLDDGREWVTEEFLKPLLERQWLLKGILAANVKEEIIQSIAALYLRNVDVDIRNSDGISAELLANGFQEISLY